jgi:arginase family enzyme
LAQDALGYQIKRGKFHNTENLITGVALDPKVMDRPGCQHGPSAAGSNRPGMGSGPSDVARKVLLIDSADNEADAIDWRTPIIN